MKLTAHRKSAFGFTLLEANLAAAFSLLALAGTFSASTGALSLLKAANQSVAASQSLQERVEQMRIANWTQITDANYLRANLLNVSTSSAQGLSQPVETLVLSAYPPPAWGSAAQTKLTRSNGAVTIDTQNTALKTASMVKVQWSLAWNAASGSRSRSGAVLVAKGGIVK